MFLYDNSKVSVPLHATLFLKAFHTLLLQNGFWPTSLEFELVVVIFTPNTCLSIIHAENMSYRERSAVNLTWCHLWDANSSSSLQNPQHKALHIPWWSLLHACYLSHSKQIEFLSSYHFNLCQNENIKDSHKLYPPTAMWFSHLLGPVTHTAKGATASLNVFKISFLKAEPASWWHH